MQYDFAAIEKKWQDNWEKTKPYRAVTGDKTRKKFYGLIEFPYPSAAGLHVGHPRPFTAIDVVTRKKRMEGYNVLFPIGFDAFGLPTENFAIKNHIHPAVVTQENIPSPRTGGYWSPDAVSRINRKLLKNAGIEEHVRFHDLRHTFATMAISSGVDVKTLSSMLGHYSAGFTLDTYTHITNDMQRGAAEKIGGFMESVTAANTPEPPDPPEESRCKVIPFEKVG